MKIFSRLKHFKATCHFCKEEGLTYGGFTNEKEEVAICDDCANKLIAGMTSWLEEQDRLKKAQEEATKDKPEEAQVDTAETEVATPEPAVEVAASQV